MRNEKKIKWTNFIKKTNCLQKWAQKSEKMKLFKIFSNVEKDNELNNIELHIQRPKRHIMKA